MADNSDESLRANLVLSRGMSAACWCASMRFLTSWLGKLYFKIGSLWQKLVVDSSLWRASRRLGISRGAVFWHTLLNSQSFVIPSLIKTECRDEMVKRKAVVNVAMYFWKGMGIKWKMSLFLFILMNSLNCMSNCAQLLQPSADRLIVSRQWCTSISFTGFETIVNL